MNKREIDMYKLQDVIQDLLNNQPIKSIAKKRKISKNTVKKYRAVLENITDFTNQQIPCEMTIEKIMSEFRQLRKAERYSENYGWLLANSEEVNTLSSGCDNLVRLNEVLAEKGFAGSYSSLVRFMRKYALENESPIIRLETKAGEVAQVDFGHIGKIYDEDTGEMAKAYVFVMVLAFSRDAYYEIVRSQDIKTWITCHIHAFEHFRGVPKIVIPDNLKSAVIKASFCDPIANRSYADLSRHYGFQIDPCLPETPEHKGKVEAGVKYVKNNFIPLRNFKNFTEANEQLAEWNMKKARERIHGTTRRKPSELFDTYEAEALNELTSLRFEIPVWKNLKVYRDIHIQFDRAYYSVPCELKGEYVWARKSDTQITIYHENSLIAAHFPRNAGQRSTVKEHYPEDKMKYMEWDSASCMDKAREIGDAVFYMVNKLINEEPIRNLRAAQNIIRLGKKYGTEKLEEAAGRAIYFKNYTYSAVKNILEKDLKTDIPETKEKQQSKLDTSYARDLAELLNMEEARHGNLCSN